MKINGELVDYLSRLSRLELEEGEKRDMAAGLERIVAYMDVLDKLDTGGAEPMGHGFPAENVLREDEEAPSWDRGALLAGAPASDGEAFLAPRAVE